MKGRQNAIEDDLKAVAQAEYELAEAHIRLDLETIGRLLHPEYVIMQPGGQIETKEAVLAAYRTGNRRWDMAVSDELEVRLYGDAARVVGRWTAAGQNNRQHFDYKARFISFWVKEDDRWQNIAYQSTELIDQ